MLSRKQISLSVKCHGKTIPNHVLSLTRINLSLLLDLNISIFDIQKMQIFCCIESIWQVLQIQQESFQIFSAESTSFLVEAAFLARICLLTVWNLLVAIPEYRFFTFHPRPLGWSTGLSWPLFKSGESTRTAKRTATSSDCLKWCLSSRKPQGGKNATTLSLITISIVLSKKASGDTAGTFPVWLFTGGN